MQSTILNLASGMSLVNREKAISKINALANNNPKVNNALKNVGLQLEKHIEKEEEEAKARLR